MEFRATEYHHGPYVDRHIRKVAETPLEGCDGLAPEQQTFGPFLDTNKPPNKKGFTVRFETEKAGATAAAKQDPIEYAFDSLFLLYDEVREQASTPRADGSTSEWMGRVVDSMECVTDRVCRNPCVENCVDFMEELEERELLDPDDLLHVENVPSALVKENSVMDLAADSDEARHLASLSYSLIDRETAVPTYFVPTYSPVDTIADKLRTVLPESYLKQLEDAFIIRTGEVKPNAGALTIKCGADADPIVESVDKLILFFDDVQMALAEKKVEVLAANLAADLMEQASEIERQATLQWALAEKKIEALAANLAKDLLELLAKQASEIEQQTTLLMSKQPEEIIAELKEILMRQAETLVRHAAKFEKQAAEFIAKRQAATQKPADFDFDVDRSDATALSDDTAKIANTKIKPPSLKMRPSELLQAVESAASVLSEFATPEELARFTKEELHRRAVEKIMSERPELEEGFTEYKTESQLLQDLMPDLEQRVVDVASKSHEKGKEKGQPEATKKSQKEGLIVLGHSSTLTPIPEADEGSAATPHSDLIEQGVFHGTIPQVPMAPGEVARYAMADAALNEESKDHDVSGLHSPEPNRGREQPTQEKDDDYYDPIVYAFDRMFLCYDDMEEERNKACGSTVPSDHIDPSDDILDHTPPKEMAGAKEARKTKEELEGKSNNPEAAKKSQTEAAVGHSSKPMSFPDDPIVNAIDRMFLCYDDIEVERNKACTACIGSTVPSDLIDPSDDILDESSPRETAKEKADEELAAKARQLLEQLQLEAAASEDRRAKEELDNLMAIKIEPRPDPFLKPEDRGEQLIKEALQVLREASMLATASGGGAIDQQYVAAVKPAPTPEQEKGPTVDLVDRLAAAFEEANDRVDILQETTSKLSIVQQLIANVNSNEMAQAEKDREIARLVEAALDLQESDKLLRSWRLAIDHPGLKGVEDGMTPQMSLDDPDKQQAKVEFEIPEMMKHHQEPCIDWTGDDSELMASINADRKLSEMEHENIFRDVSKGLQEPSGGIIARADNKDAFTIYNAPAFTEGNSSSAEQLEDRFENHSEVALKVLGGESSVSVVESDRSGVRDMASSE